MKIRFTSLALLLAAVCLLTSCLNSDDDTSYDFYDDTAISAFSLGTLNRYLHTTTAAGNDTIYKTTVSGSAYKMTIDQLGGKIYNTDSLPYGTDVKHVLATIAAVNSGVILLKAPASDSLSYYSSSDSIDFSTPRVVRIVSQSGERYRDYTVTLNVRQVPEGTVDWRNLGESQEIAQLSDTRAFAAGGKVFVFGTLNGQIVGYSSAINDGTQWTQLNTTLSQNASIVAKGNSLYAIDNGSVLSSTDGNNWNVVATNNNLKKLVAASTAHLYALTTDGGTAPSGIAVSADNGQTWSADSLDDSPSLLPDEEVGYACTPLRTNDSIDQVVIVGRCSASGSLTAQSWSKLDDYSSQPIAAPWSYGNSSGKTAYTLGNIHTLTVTAYAGNPVALTGNGATVSKLLISHDGGLTWKDSGSNVPDGLTAVNGNLAITTDSEGSLWIISGGQIWKL